jgi:hypothetical protein
VPKQCYEKVQKICKCRNNVTKKYRRFLSAETMLRKSTEDLSVSKQCYEKVQKICKCRNNIMKKYWRFVSAETIKKYRFVSAETIRKYRFVSAETMLRKSTEDLSVPRQCSEKVQNICQRRHKYRRCIVSALTNILYLSCYIVSALTNIMYLSRYIVSALINLLYFFVTFSRHWQICTFHCLGTDKSCVLFRYIVSSLTNLLYYFVTLSRQKK